MKLRAVRPFIACIAIAAATACGAGSGPPPVATSQAAAEPLTIPSSGNNVLIVQRGTIPARERSTTSPLTKTSRLGLEAACIGKGTLEVTVTARGAGSNFTSTYPFACAPRENVATFPLGRFAAGTRVTVSDKGSTGRGLYFSRIVTS